MEAVDDCCEHWFTYNKNCGRSEEKIAWPQKKKKKSTNCSTVTGTEGLQSTSVSPIDDKIAAIIGQLSLKRIIPELRVQLYRPHKRLQQISEQIV